MKKIIFGLLVLISASATAQYTPMFARGYQFKYLKADSGLVFPVRDTTVVSGITKLGSVVVRPGDSSLYMYTNKWNKLAIDSAGIASLFTNKVDSVKILTDTLFYYINGTAYGSVFTVSSAYPDALTFDSTTGDLTLGRNGMSDLTESLEGRYDTIGHSHTASDITDFTTAGRNLISAGSGLTYNAATGVIAFPGGGSYLTELNGLTAPVQTFAIDTTAANFGIVSSGTIHTIKFPARLGTASGTVTNVATGLGLSGGPITTTGTILVDTSSASILSRQRAANTYATIAQNALKVNISDTSSMLTPYFREVSYGLSKSGHIVSADTTSSTGLVSKDRLTNAFSLKEGFITAPYTIGKYWTGYKTFGSFSDSARAAISLTTTGTSGSATYNNSTGVLNIPNYTLTDTHFANTNLTATANRTHNWDYKNLAIQNLGTLDFFTADPVYAISSRLIMNTTAINLSTENDASKHGIQVANGGVGFYSGLYSPDVLNIEFSGYIPDGTTADSVLVFYVDSGDPSIKHLKKIAASALGGGGSGLTYPNTANKYLNGYGNFVTLNSDTLTEGSTNKFYTDTRSRAALSFAAGSGAYNSSTGVITIPTNTNQLTNGAGFLTSTDISGKLNISDTASMLANYRTSYQPLSERTTVGKSFYSITNPSALGYVRTNADNTVTHRTYANVKTDLGLDNVENAAASGLYVPLTRTVAGNALSSNVTQDQITGLSSTGIIKRTAANTLGIATAGTDYQAALTGTGFVKSTAGTISYDNSTYVTSAGTVTNFSGSLAGDVTGTQSATTVGKINGVSLAGLATGILKNTTSTGVPSIAVAGTDYVAPSGTFFIGTTSIAHNRASASQSLTGITSIDGSAATLTTPRGIYGNNFDGSAALTQIIASTYGGTGNGFTKFSGPATTEKTFTLPNASATILTDNAAVTVAQGGTGRQTSTTAYGLIAAGTTATGALQTLPAGATTEILVGGGASALPVWTTATGSGAPVRATSPTLTTPNLGTPSALTLTNATGLPVGGISATGTPSGTTYLRGDGTWSTVTGGSGADPLGTYIVQTATNAPTNAQVLGSLGTGIVKNTTTTGVLSIAVAADFPTLNQNTTGSAASLTTTRTIWGQNFNGTANVTGDITLGTGNITMTGSIGATGARVTKGWFTDGEFTNAPTIGGTAATGSGGLVRATSPALVTPDLGTPSALTLTNATGMTGLSKAITIVSPTSSENATLYYTTKAITVTQVRTVMLGSSQSITFTLNYGTDRSTATGTIVASNTFDSGDAGYQTTGFAHTLNTTSIPANSYIWITSSATSGTINDFNLTMTYTQ